MPQIDRPTYRMPLRDLPLSLFIHPSGSQTASLLGTKRPYSPSSIVSPSKRRLLAVEGVLSPRSPFKKAVTDLKQALPSLTPGRDLLQEFQRPRPAPSIDTHRKSAFTLEGVRGTGGLKIKPQGNLLAPSLEIGTANQPKPRVAAAPSKAEAQLLEILAKAPKPTQVFLPGAGHSRPMRNKEDDPEEVHYPGFDICADEDNDQGVEFDMGGATDQDVKLEDMDADNEEDEQEESKENQAPYNRFATPTLSARSSMSSLGAPPRRRTERQRMQEEVDGDGFSSDDEFL